MESTQLLLYKDDTENPTFVVGQNAGQPSHDDHQALQMIISLWSGLAPETKIEIMQVIEAARQTQQPALKCLL